MERLKRCPFCDKGEPVVTLNTAKLMEDCIHFEDSECPCFKYDEPCGAYIVVCDYTQGGCGASCGYASSKEKAIKKWNMRFSEIEPLAEERVDQEIEKNPVVQAIDNAIKMRF